MIEWNLLQLAVGWGDLDLIKVLIERKADPFIKDRLGNDCFKIAKMIHPKNQDLIRIFN